jgi:hypothetical protein
MRSSLFRILSFFRLERLNRSYPFRRERCCLLRLLGITGGSNLEQSNLSLFYKILTALISRRPEIFGNDAHLFRPERWLDVEKAPSMKGFSNGVFANTYVLAPLPEIMTYVRCCCSGSRSLVVRDLVSGIVLREFRHILPLSFMSVTWTPTHLTHFGIPHDT